MLRQLILAVSIVSTTLSLGGCVSSQQGDVFSRGETRTAQQVATGTVESLRPVKIEGSKSLVGPAAGAAVGGIAGSSVGGGKGSLVGAVIGAVGGGLAGSAAEEGLTRTQGVEITVKEDSGTTRAYVQEMRDGEVFKVGDRVRITTVNGTARVSH